MLPQEKHFLDVDEEYERKKKTKEIEEQERKRAENTRRLEVFRLQQKQMIQMGLRGPLKDQNITYDFHGDPILISPPSRTIQNPKKNSGKFIASLYSNTKGESKILDPEFLFPESVSVKDPILTRKSPSFDLNQIGYRMPDIYTAIELKPGVAFKSGRRQKSNPVKSTSKMNVASLQHGESLSMTQEEFKLFRDSSMAQMQESLTEEISSLALASRGSAKQIPLKIGNRRGAIKEEESHRKIQKSLGSSEIIEERLEMERTESLPDSVLRRRNKLFPKLRVMSHKDLHLMLSQETNGNQAESITNSATAHRVVTLGSEEEKGKQRLSLNDKFNNEILKQEKGKLFSDGIGMNVDSRFRDEMNSRSMRQILEEAKKKAGKQKTVRIRQNNSDLFLTTLPKIHRAQPPVGKTMGHGLIPKAKN